MRIAQIGGIDIPKLAFLGARQSMRSAARSTILPMADGTSIKQTYAGTQKKIVGTISASGPIPPGLDGLDYDGQILIRAASERSITSSVQNIVIPSERRGDAGYEPWGRGFVDGKPIQTAVVMAGDTAQLAAVTGATQYQVLWYPEFYVWVEGDGPEVNDDTHDAMTYWRMNIRQV